MRKILTILAIGCIALMVTGVTAETFNYFMQDDITVTSHEILKINGNLVEEYNLVSNISVNASESETITYELEYIGSNPSFNLSAVQTNNMSGITHTLKLDGQELEHDFFEIQKNTPATLTVTFTGAHNLSAGVDTYQLQLQPTP